MNLTFEQKYHLLLEISRKIRDTLDLDEIMSHLLDTIQTVVAYDAAGIFVLNQDIVRRRRGIPNNIIAGMCWRGYNPPPTGSDEMLTHGKGIIGHVIQTGSPLVAPDVRQDQYYVAARENTLSEIAVPILRNERALGALNLESDDLNTYSQDDLEVLQFFADAAAIALEKAMLHRQILEKELLEKQLQMAMEVQKRLLPMEDPIIPGYDIAGVYIPAEEIGGDYYDYLQVNHGNLGLAVADVSGHGIASALAMTAFRGLLRMHTHGKLHPSEIAQNINRLLPEFIGDSHFITMSYGVLNPESNGVTFVNCGHPSPILLHKEGNTESLDSNGPAFGIYNTANYVNESKPLNHGDILMMYTDGVVEIDDPDGEGFGIERLVNIIKKSRKLPAKELIRRVIHETQTYAGIQTYLDDFTLMVVKKD
jgi:phosphoserine phosphatase RsbU/P